MSFNIHGRYSIKADGNIIIVDAEGPYNEEMVLAYKKDYQQAMIEICEQYKYWSQITYLNHESILLPEAEAVLTELNCFKKSKGMTHGVIILVDVEAPHLVESQYQRIYRAAGMVLNIASDIEEAKAWLKDEMNL